MSKWAAERASASERRSYAVDGRMHLEVPSHSLSLSLECGGRSKSDYGAFNCRKHLRSAAGERERKREGYVCYVMCVMGLWAVAYFSATFQRLPRGKRERKDLKRQFNEQVERTTRKDFRRRKHGRCILSTQLATWYNNHSDVRPQFAKSHECPLRRVNERVDKEC